jgi:hypothetical protein
MTASNDRRLRVLVWHVHGAWAHSLITGRHEYLLPTTPEKDARGTGKSGRDWPHGTEISPVELADADIDVVVFQRPEEIDWFREWSGRAPAEDVPAVYVEHNTPRGDVPNTRHPLADRDDIPIVHVTHFNQLMWDCGRAPNLVIEHGVEDPGWLYTGELDRAAVVINEPIRRWRVTGTDLLPEFSVPLDVFGMGGDGLDGKLGLPSDRLTVAGDLPSAQLHREMARRRMYVHPFRWTSLGLALIEAMMLGMPVVALATTEAVNAVPSDAGVLSTRLDELAAAARAFLADREVAASYGKHARAAALARFSLPVFQRHWDDLFAELVR